MTWTAEPAVEDADVVVLGSGAAGLGAALTAAVQGARVRLLEASGTIGGTTTWSGGLIWMPGNHRTREAGVPDSREGGEQYMTAAMEGKLNRTLMDPFLDLGPGIVRFFEDHTDLRFRHCDVPDSLAELPGGLDRGRNVEAHAFKARSLGEWRKRVRKSPYASARLSTSELYSTMPRMAAKMILRSFTDEVASGTAIVCGLLKACLDRGVSISVDARGTELIEEDGSVVGVEAQVPGGALRVRAAGGVILATGGFDWNPELVDRFLPLKSDEIKRGTPPSLKGDGLLMAERAGANLVYTDEAWWWPVVAVPGDLYEGQQLARMVLFERSRRHSITVNRKGERFANEAMHHMGHEMLERDDEGRLRHQPAWIVFDHRYRKRNVIVTRVPIQRDPPWLIKDATLAGLARKIGIDADGLARTVARWNEMCRNGEDVDFGRGSAEYDRHTGDPDGGSPNLGTLERSPYYALPLSISPVGTKGGPEIDATGRVLRPDGQPIDGLYAAGNVAGRLFGPAIYGAGITIATGLVFGHLGAKHAAARATASSEASVR